MRRISHADTSHHEPPDISALASALGDATRARRSCSPSRTGSAPSASSCSALGAAAAEGVEPPRRRCARPGSSPAGASTARCVNGLAERGRRRRSYAVARCGARRRTCRPWPWRPPRRGRGAAVACSPTCSAGARVRRSTRDGTREFVVFLLGGGEYALPIGAVREIVRHLPPRPLPRARPGRARHRAGAGPAARGRRRARARLGLPADAEPASSSSSRATAAPRRCPWRRSARWCVAPAALLPPPVRERRRGRRRGAGGERLMLVLRPRRDRRRAALVACRRARLGRGRRRPAARLAGPPGVVAAFSGRAGRRLDRALRVAERRHALG